jgi:hypothetical protein
MQILFKMTITASVTPSEDDVAIERSVSWPPDLRMPVKEDVIWIGGMSRAVEEVHLAPLSFPYATVWLEDFIDPDPDESAGIDFPDWRRA